jgi:2-polyprenyl-3-methyl-5-hydroxy-6-metoxy-1,4-benzoquinol methylase
MVDIGKYNKDPDLYQKLVDEMYRDHPPITLSSEYAQFIENNLLRFLIRLARYKFVAKMLRKTDRVLEIGSSSGLGSIFLSQHCQYVKGLEIKQTELDEARLVNRRKNVVFENADFFTFPIGEPYDAVVALDVIEHMPVEIGQKLVTTASKHLRPDGMLIIGTPSLYSYEYQSPLSKASHVKCYDLPELVDLFTLDFGRTLSFSMNDEMVHTGYHKMAWYYFVLGLVPKKPSDQ